MTKWLGGSGDVGGAAASSTVGAGGGVPAPGAGSAPHRHTGAHTVVTRRLEVRRGERGHVTQVMLHHSSQLTLTMVTLTSVNLNHPISSVAATVHEGYIWSWVTSSARVRSTHKLVTVWHFTVKYFTVKYFTLFVLLCYSLQANFISGEKILIYEFWNEKWILIFYSWPTDTISVESWEEQIMVLPTFTKIIWRHLPIKYLPHNQWRKNGNWIFFTQHPLTAAQKNINEYQYPAAQDFQK